MKHEFIFETKHGKIRLGTDDLNDLAKQSWFRAFLGLGDSSGDFGIPDFQSDDLEIQKRAEALAERIVKEMQPRIEKKQKVNYLEISPDKMTPDVWDSLSNEQKQQYSARYPNPNSFLDITPDQMTQEVWESLSTEQQQQYSNKYSRPR